MKLIPTIVGKYLQERDDKPRKAVQLKPTVSLYTFMYCIFGNKSKGVVEKTPDFAFH